MILQAGEFGRYLGKLSLYLNDKSIQSWEYQLQSVDSSVPEEPTLAYMIGNLAAGVEANPWFGPVYTDVIAQAETEIKKPLGEELFKDTPLGNLVSDAFRDKTGTDIAFYPQGFCSLTIYAGEVKGADIFQAIPYGFDQATGLGFKLATFQTDGMSIISGLEFAVYHLPYVEDFFLHSSNFSYAYNSSNPPGSRVDYSSISVNGQPLDPIAVYTVTVPDGVVPFLDQIPGFQVNNLMLTEDFMYVVVRDFMISHSPVSYYTEGRVINLALFAEPLDGVMALSNVVELFRENGSINKQGVANRLQRRLNRVQWYLQNGRYRVALWGLRIFKFQVRFQTFRGHISSWASDKLIYLTNKLIESIPVSLTKATQEATEEMMPQQFQLLQNYPNPFNPQTEIVYSLPYDTDVRLTIYNMLGQQVKVLADGYQSGGTKMAIWDGRNENGERVSSGIYFYKLQAGEFVQTKRMNLIK